MNLDILALDLGTSTGYAYNRGNEFFCGTWMLATDKEIRQWGRERQTRTKDPRIERLCVNVGQHHFDLVVFEDVQFATYTLQTQLWSSLRASVWLCANVAKIDCVPVHTLKKFAGHGGADKNAMSRFLKIRHPNLWTPKLDDNAIDAIWIWLWSKHTFSHLN